MCLICLVATARMNLRGLHGPPSQTSKTVLTTMHVDGPDRIRTDAFLLPPAVPAGDVPNVTVREVASRLGVSERRVRKLAPDEHV